MDYLSSLQDFNLLSLKDLVQARDQYHVHLMHKENVIATALGRYLIRKTDPWPTGTESLAADQAKGKRAPVKPKRTLDNSEVRPYSWPCVLVFVQKWVPNDQFGNDEDKVAPEEMIPRALYMPDGRVVPVCVVQAARDENQPAPLTNLIFPKHLIGGGFPVLADVQQQEHVASLGCLLTDGHLVYALTNRHVSGQTGEPVYSLLGGNKVQIGTASDKQLTRQLFQDLYPEWPGKDVYVNLDIGLIAVEDKNDWTAQIYGIGPIGKLADLSTDNLSLRLVGCPVRAYGCGSGQMQGQIHALFYRYKSVGGFEYVADFLIGPAKDKPFRTHPGDSGTIWLLDTGDPHKGLMPMAVQWGGHVFIDQAGESRLPYALATSLSTVCSLLEVDVIRDWSIGPVEYWGAVGHYTIANKACAALTNPKLKALMTANLDAITFEAAKINEKNLKGLSNESFVPLADVPDLIWKRGHFSRGEPEHPNHFADMDKQSPTGETLLQMCQRDPRNVDVKVWQKYYDEVDDPSRGLLPFRVQQIYQQMVEFVKQGDVTRFVCAAGVVSHYVGDACQPLHISYLFDGDPADTVSVPMPDPHTGQTVMTQVPRAAGVHAAFEADMVDFHVAEIMQGIDQSLANGALPSVLEPPQAAVAVVELMGKTLGTIPPRQILDQYVSVKGQTPRQVADALWSKFGPDTIRVITEGSRHLAGIWQSAWVAGDGDHTIHNQGAVDTAALVELYDDRSFLPSKTLDQIGPLLQSGTPVPAHS